MEDAKERIENNQDIYLALPIWTIPKNKEMDGREEEISLCWSIPQMNDRMIKKKKITIFTVCNKWIDLGFEDQWLLTPQKERQPDINSSTL